MYHIHLSTDHDFVLLKTPSPSVALRALRVLSGVCRVTVYSSEHDMIVCQGGPGDELRISQFLVDDVAYETD